MSLPIPDLDDRRFQDLVDEAKRRLALHCPEWSDHNVSDPGVMLIELFADMVDQLNFRLNQVPDRLYLQMLELMGIRRLPPGAAIAELTFWLASEARRPLVVPALTQVATPRRAGVLPTTFTVPADLPITPCGFREVGTGRAGGVVAWREASVHEDDPVVCFADPPALDDALYVRLDASVPACVVRLRLRCDPAFGQGVDPTRPPLVWEVQVPGDWLPCPCSSDTTGGLNTDGEVVLHLPGGLTTSPTVLRCRVTDAEVPRYDLSPQVQGIEAGTIGATAVAYHAEIVEDELLGVSDGHPGQRFSLARPPLTWPAGLRAVPAALEVHEGGERQEWTRVDDFSQSGEEDRHYTLDAAAGEVAFGPAIRARVPRRSGPRSSAALHRVLELHGAVPTRGARILMRRYMTGGGEAGNVAAGQLCVVKTDLPFVKRAENRLAAAGGVAAETIEEVRARGPIELRTLERAVTAEDYEQFALRDSRVARVRCYAAALEHGHPSLARLLIVPRVRLDLERPLELSELEPSAELQESVRAELEPRRVLGASFEVASPSYIGLRIDARVLLRAGFEPQAVERAAERALARFFHPTLGGPEGHGWPFGRAVYSGMAYLVLQRVAGVELVEDVRFIPVDLRTGTRGDHTQGFTLGPDELIVSRAHAVAATTRETGS